MKKIILLCVICGFAMGETMYSNVVKDVSLSENLNDVAGKLLPTNGVNIVDKKGDVIKIELIGYQNSSSPNIIYFTPKARILAMAFSKQKAPQVEVLGQEDGFNKVKVTAFTKNGEFTSNLDEIFAVAKQKYEESCSVCHQLHPSNAYPANRWSPLVKAMLSRTPLNSDESQTMIEYLQKHSKDVNLKETK